MKGIIKILLVEDNPADIRLVDIHLKASFGDGYALSTYSYLSAVLKLSKANTFDIIILDLSLPDSIGLEGLTKVSEKFSGCPIIILTGLADESMGVQALKLGAQDYLIKGKASAHSLRRSINFALQRHKLLKVLSEKQIKLEEKTLALLKEQQQLALAQKISHIGSWELDLSDLSVKWSEELYKIYGVDSKTFSPTIEKFMELVHPEDREYVINFAQDHYQSKTALNYFYRIVRPNGEVRMINGRGEPVLDISGNIIRAIGTAQDITEKIAEDELEKLASAATKSYNSVTIINRDGKIEWVNEAFTKLNGYTLEEMKNTDGEIVRRGNKTGHSEESYYYETILKEKKPFSYESKNHTKDGREYWVITTLSPVLDKHGEVERIISIDSDITAMKNIEAELILSNKIAEHSLMKGNKALDDLTKAKTELEASMKVKEQFLANMSHEIRTPMNAIVGFTDLVMKTPLSPEQKQYLEYIKTSGANLIVIINDILDISRIQSGKVSLEQIDFRLSQTIAIVTEMMMQKSVEKKIKLFAEVDKKISDNLIGDPTRLNQILLNLIGNAIKFTEEGEVKIIVSLVADNAEDIELKFSITDTGIGIPQDKLSSIFDAFTQATNETTRKYGGTGLGLTIVKQLVNIMGGNISVQSIEGKGSTFSFHLTFKKGKLPKQNGTVHVVENETTENIEGLNILLVEDNLFNQTLAKKVLTGWKWKVEVADNGAIALDKLKEKDFDIILMDMQMPEMDGYEATTYIRKKFPQPKCKIPIMAMTAHAMSSEEEKCLKLGMNGYISKPFDQKVLYARIISIINACRYNANKDEIKT